MRPAFFLIGLALLCASPVFAGRSMSKDALPAPRIMAPTDDVDLTGKDSLEFRWTSEGSGLRVYDFRLYKGAQTIDANLVEKQQFPAGQTSHLIGRDRFEEGQTYAFSIRQIGATKSRSNYTVFKVIKK